MPLAPFALNFYSLPILTAFRLSPTLMSCFFQEGIAAAMARQAELEWPLLIFLVDCEDTATETVVAETHLHTASICQLLRRGTTEFTLFLSACPGMVAEPLPRVHLFPPPSRRLPPIVLAGNAFAAAKIAEAVAYSQQWPDDMFSRLNHFAGKEVDAWAAAAAAAERRERQVPSAVVPIPRPAAPAAATPPAPVGGASATMERRSTSAAVLVTLQSAAKKEVVMCAPSANAAVLWDKACALLRQPGLQFKLVAGDRTMVSREAAAAVSISEVRGGVVEIVVPAPESQPVPAATPASAAAPVPQTSAAASAIAVRCLLPDGSSVDLGRSFHTTDMLSAVASALAERVGRSDFSLSNSYPPRRFADADMQTPLQSLGLSGNTTFRVTWAASYLPPPPPQGQQASRGRQAPGPEQTGGGFFSAASDIIGNAAQFAAGLLRPVPGSAGTGQPPAPQAAKSQAPRGGFATLATLATDEEKAREGDPNKRKSNRYFGGHNTEYEGEPKQ
jgi:hypothetical protein